MRSIKPVSATAVLALVAYLLAACNADTQAPATATPTSPLPIATPEPTTAVPSSPPPSPVPPPTSTPLPIPINESNLANVRVLQTLAGHANVVRSVAFFPDGLTLASGTGGSSNRSDTQVRLWDPLNGSLRLLIPAHSDVIWAVAVSPAGSQVASGSRDHTAKVIDPSGGWLQHVFLHPGEVNSLAFSPDGTILATGVAESLEGTVFLWNLATESSIRNWLAHPYSVLSIAFSPDGQTLATGAVDRTVKLWRVSDGSLLRTFPQDGQGDKVIFSPDGSLLATGMCAESNPQLQCLRGEVWIWRVNDGTMERRLSGPSSWVHGVVFSPDGSLTIGASADRGLYFWRTSDGQLLHTLIEHQSAILDLAISPDGSLLASASVDETVRIWGLP